MLCVVLTLQYALTLKTNFRLGFDDLKKRIVYKHMYLFPRHLDLINKREGEGNGRDLSDQSLFTIVVWMY